MSDERPGFYQSRTISDPKSNEIRDDIVMTRGHDKSDEARLRAQLAAAEVEIARLKAENSAILDHAATLRAELKDIYNASCFSVETAPDGMLADFRRAVNESADKVLRQTREVAKKEYASGMACGEEQARLAATEARAERAEAERDAAEAEIEELRDEVWSIAHTTREANEFVAESLKRYPGRAAGLTEGGQSCD